MEKKRERLLSVREKRRDGSRGVCGESWGWEMLWEAKSPPEHNAAPLIQAADMGSPPLRETKEPRRLQTRDELRHLCTTGSAMETFALFARIVAFVLQSLPLVIGCFCEHFQPWGLLVNKLPLVYLILLLAMTLFNSFVILSESHALFFHILSYCFFYQIFLFIFNFFGKQCRTSCSLSLVLSC